MTQLNIKAGDSISQIAEAVFGLGIPHCDALGLVVEDFAPPKMTLRLPFQEGLVGNPETGVLHGGGLSALIDTACGFLAMTMLEPMQPVATLDLRVDFLRPAVSAEVFCEAEVYRVTRSIVFARARAWQTQGEGVREVAAAAGSFMITGQEIGRGANHAEGAS